MSTPLHYTACIALIAARTTSIGASAHGGDAISPELIQKYEDAGGIPATFRCWDYNDLPGRVQGFYFHSSPTDELPAILVPFGLKLNHSIFYTKAARGWKPTGADLTPFLHLKNLTDLSLTLSGSLSHMTADKKIVSQIWQFKELRHLQLAAWFSDEEVTNLLALKFLESLDLLSTRFTDKGVTKLSGLERLKALDVGHAHVTGTGFRQHWKFKNLSILILGHWTTDDGLACVGRLEQLATLRILPGAACTDVGISEIGKLRNLKTLVVGYRRMSDVGLRAIARINGLRHLDISWTKITDNGLRSLSDLQELRTLDISVCKQLTDLRPLANLRELRTLDMALCKGLTDRGFEEIDQLQHLSSIHMPSVPISDEAVKYISKLKEMEYLNLHDTRITDASIDDLASMKQLRHLYVGRTKMSRDGCKRLQTLLPNCDVYY